MYAVVDKDKKKKKHRSQSETAEESIYEELDDVKSDVQDLRTKSNEQPMVLRSLSIIGTPEEPTNDDEKKLTKDDSAYFSLDNTNDVLNIESEIIDDQPEIEPKIEQVIDEEVTKIVNEKPIDLKVENEPIEEIEVEAKIVNETDDKPVIEADEKPKKLKKKSKSKDDPERKLKKKRKKSKSERSQDEPIKHAPEWNISGTTTNPDLTSKTNDDKVIVATAAQPLSDPEPIENETKIVKVEPVAEVSKPSPDPEPSPRSVVNETPKEVSARTKPRRTLPKIHSLSVEKMLMEQNPEPKVEKEVEPKSKPESNTESKMESNMESNTDAKTESTNSKQPKDLPKVELSREIKGRSAETSRNPLARRAQNQNKSVKKLDPNSLIKTSDDLPNFRMAPASTANVPGTRTKESKPPELSHENSKVEEIETDDIEIDLRLFAKPKIVQKKKPQQILAHGLTKEEEKFLEEAQKAKLAEEQKLKEKEIEKLNKQKELRLQRKAEEESRLAKTRELKIEKDLKAKAKKEMENSVRPTTEDLRAQLKQMTANSVINKKVVDDLVIEENDDLLPNSKRKISSSSISSSTSSTTSTSNEGLVKEPLPNKGMFYLHV